MSGALTVLLNEVKVGTITRSQSGRLSFSYDAIYRARREIG